MRLSELAKNAMGATAFLAKAISGAIKFFIRTIVVAIAFLIGWACFFTRR